MGPASPALAARPEPLDAVDIELRAHLYARFADGSFDTMVAAWRLAGPSVVKELVALATTPAQDTAVNPLLSFTATPQLHFRMRVLFVGFSHNLLLESLVSRLSTLEKTHAGTHSLTLHNLFMYKGRQTPIRKERLSSELRKAGGNGTAEAKVRAATGKELTGSANRSKGQLKLLVAQTEEASKQYTHGALFKRGEHGVRQQLRAQRKAHDGNRDTLASTKVGSLARTCGGARRAKPLAASECTRLIAPAAPAGTKVAPARSNIHKKRTRIAPAKKQIATERRELAATAKERARKQPRVRTGKQQRRAADPRPRGGAAAKRKADEAGPSAAPLPAPKRRAATDAATRWAKAVEEAEESDDESADGHVTDEEDDEEGEAEGEGEGEGEEENM